jgi:hypothetical protein
MGHWLEYLLHFTAIHDLFLGAKTNASMFALSSKEHELLILFDKIGIVVFSDDKTRVELETIRLFEGSTLVQIKPNEGFEGRVTIVVPPELTL